jgi:hypothetical protein
MVSILSFMGGMHDRASSPKRVAIAATRIFRAPKIPERKKPSVADQVEEYKVCPALFKGV